MAFAFIASLFAVVTLALVVAMRPACVTSCLADRADEARIVNGIWTEGLR